MTVRELGHAVIDPVLLKPVPAAEPVVADAGRYRLSFGVDPVACHLEQPGVLWVTT